jgi:hypothetical protein
VIYEKAEAVFDGVSHVYDGLNKSLRLPVDQAI